jgi:predicted AAA+ superfamily ATPase
MRYLRSFIQKDLNKKMVFIGGPRQCGKTTLAKDVLSQYSQGLYMNWDLDEHRQMLLKKQWFERDKLLIFDEIHKYKSWKNWLKGVFDTQREDHHILVTGSARLDVYRRGGDSLLGRYHYWRLHPFTLSEIPGKLTPQETFKRLMTVGGFPEPFLDGDETEARRWRRERFDRVLRDDIRDLELVKDIQTMSLFLDALRTRVGGLVVLANIAQDLQTSPQTLARWLEIFERMYLVFVVKPYTKNLPRAVQKPPKVYFFDNADVIGDEGARFENLVASHLLKKIHFLEDRDGYRYELRYIRDKEGREVDFAIVKDGTIDELIEAKFADQNILPSLVYYAERLKPRRVTQVVAKLKRAYSQNQLHVETPFECLMDLG